MSIQKDLTRDEFHQLTEHPDYADRRYELIEGEIVEVSPNWLTSVIAARIIKWLSIFVDDHELGYVSGADGGYAISDENEFNPDVAFISRTRLPQMPTGEAPIPPDFAVEVISPSDLKHRENRIEKKLRVYQRLQLPLLWYVYPHRQQVDVYEYGVHTRTAGIDDVLDGGDVLKGFTLAVRTIFDL